jgi:hypothetical protein
MFEVLPVILAVVANFKHFSCGFLYLINFQSSQIVHMLPENNFKGYEYHDIGNSYTG